MLKTYYVYHKNGVYSGTSKTITEFDTFPVNSTFAPMIDLQPGEFARFDGESWYMISEMPVVPVIVPHTVNPMQAKRSLARAGHLAGVVTIMDALATDDETRISWENAPMFERYDSMILAMQAQLGLTDTQMDDLFIEAGTI